MEHTVNKVRMSTKHVHETGQDAHASINIDHWILISLEDIEMTMLSSDMDPKLWKEAMASYDAAEWVEGLYVTADGRCEAFKF